MDDVWTNAISKVTAAGLTRKQVEIVWMKHAVIDPTGGFPGRLNPFRRSSRPLRKRAPEVP